jgi:hypothetical protein
MTRPSSLEAAGGLAMESHGRSGRAPSGGARSVAGRKRGRALVVAGWVVAMVGVVLYCAASFADASGADLAAIVFRGAVPAARAALLVIGAGTLVWLVGTVLHLSAELDAAYGEPAGGENEERMRRRTR